MQFHVFLLDIRNVLIPSLHLIFNALQVSFNLHLCVLCILEIMALQIEFFLKLLIFHLKKIISALLFVY